MLRAGNAASAARLLQSHAHPMNQRHQISVVNGGLDARPLGCHLCFIRPTDSNTAAQ
jgi:hypothetical protein